MRTQVDTRLSLDYAMEKADLPVVACDAEGRLTVLSPAMERILGHTFAPLTGWERIYRFQMTSEDGGNLLSPEELPLARALRGEVVTDAVIAIRAGDGSIARLRCNALPLPVDGPDDDPGAIGLIHDLTAEYEAMREADEFRARLLATVNHELRTPLTVMVGYAETLEELWDELPETARRAVDGLVRGAERMQGLLGDLKDLMDLESHVRLYPVDSDVVIVVRSVVDALICRFDTRGIRVDVRTPDELTVPVDVCQFERALTELLKNAASFAPPDSVVTVDVSVDTDLFDTAHVIIEVADSGAGIPARDRARLCQPFEVGTDSRQLVNARGMGLAIASTVALGHGGRLVLDEGPAGGLSARLCVPVVRLGGAPGR